MGRHAYLIMAHHKFDLLRTLLRMLDDQRNDIYLHIDKKAKGFNFREFNQLCRNARVIYPQTRINVRWGTQSQVRTEMILMRTAVQNGPYEYYHLISGVDLPLRSQDEIHNVLEGRRENYLFYEAETKRWNAERISLYHGLIPEWIPGSEVVNSRLVKMQQRLGVNRLKGKVHVCKGSNWATLTQSAVEMLVQQEKSIKKLTRFSHCADELYKQTILFGKGCPMAGTDLRFTIWEDIRHPKTLTMEDLPELRRTKALFARKFDPDVDNEVIRRVVQMAGGKAENG